KSVCNDLAIVLAISVLPTPAGPSTSKGLFSCKERKIDMATVSPVIYPCSCSIHLISFSWIISKFMIWKQQIMQRLIILGPCREGLGSMFLISYIGIAAARFY